MEKRQLGRTQMQVSAISFGALPIQRCSLQEAGPVLSRALDEGINFIDTARAYSDSEEKIGMHISKRRSEYYLASKSMARSAEKMKKDIELSLELLKTDYIDLYQVHNIKKREDIETVLAPGGAFEALLEMKRRGKIRFIGVTGHSFDLLVEAIKTDKFDTVQVPYNIIEQNAANELFPLARKLNMGIIAMKPLGGGQIEHIEYSLRFVLQQENLVAIPGMDTEQHVCQNILAMNPVRPLTQEELSELEKEADIVGKTFCRRCGYCLPCTVGIDIPQIFVFRLQYNRYGLTKAIPDRYKGMPVKASACVDCKICETRCPYDLPIRTWLKEMVEKLEK